jgi:hypothetical protein
MTGRCRSHCRSWKIRLRSSEVFNTLLGFSILFLFAWPSSGFATGFFGPIQYLDNGGRNIDLSPEFFWELEVKRLSAGFHPPEKPLLVRIDESNGENNTPNPKISATAEADAKDFDQAIQDNLTLLEVYQRSVENCNSLIALHH